jgi:hypothetical protein
MSRALRPLILLLVLLITSSAWAKDFYMTVRRDFSSAERPQIDVDYRSRDPLLIRVMRPKDQTAFIATQLDLRRAWRAPKVEDNLANALIDGFNRTFVDFDWLRIGLNADFRKSLQEKMGGGQWGSRTTGRLTEGPDKLISAADSYEVLQEFSMHPDESDSKREFDVPGFYFGEEGQFTTVPVSLNPLPVGFYVVQVIQGKSEGQVVLVINDLVAHMHQSSGRALVRVVNRAGAAVQAANVRVRNLQGKWIANSKTNNQGIADLKDFNVNDSIVAIESEKRGVAIMDGEFFQATVVFPDVYLYSDRPMYRAGDLVQFRGIVRHQESGWSRLWKRAENGAKVEVRFVPVNPDPEKSVAEPKINATINAFGTFAGSFKVPEGGAGVYRIVAKVVDADHVSEVRVKDYIKPLFFVELKSEQQTLREGDELKVDLKVERYAGGVPTGLRYSYTLYRTRVSVPEWVGDAGMTETGSAATYSFDASEKSSTSSLELMYSGDDLTLDDSGKTQIKVEVPQKERGPYDYQYVFKVRAFDADGNSAWGNIEFVDLKSDVVAQVRGTNTLAEQGQAAEFWIRAVKQSGASYGVTSGIVKIFQRGYKTASKEISTQSFKTNEAGTYRIKVPTDLVGEIRAVVTVKDAKGRPSTAEAQMLVAPGKSLDKIVDVADLVILSRKDDFAPGETAKALLLLPEGWGPNKQNSGRVFVTIASDKIYSHQVMNIPGNAFWFELPIEETFGTGVYAVFAYPDPAQGWIEKRIRFRIPKKDRLLNVKVKADKGIINPGAKQKLQIKVMDQSGKPLESEFSVSVVDKAVLDLQPEFRPHLLEFFYPTQRLNLMTFLSSHFQGYGYGEAVARLFKSNMSWAAPKGNPPEQLFEKDTAYWIAQVKTNKEGEASVQFEVPPNQTTWEISVVAADNQGRFGEARSQFASRRTQSVLIATPNAMRVGDELDVRLTVITTEKAAKPVPFALEFSTDGVAGQGLPTNVKGEVSPTKNPTFYHRILFPTEPADGKAVMTAKLKVNNVDLRQDWKLGAMGGNLEYTDYVKPNGGQFAFKLLKAEKVEEAELFVAQGLSGSILPSLKWLVQYPHGCVEQVTNATVPNLVIPLFFEKRASAKLTSEQKAWLAEAKKNAQAGLLLLKNYQNPEGAFGWFAGDAKGNESMTYFVLLSFASSPDVPGTNASFWRALEYLKKTNPAPKSAKAYSIAFIDSWLGGSAFFKMPVEKEAQIRFLAEAAVAKEGNPFHRALILRTMNNYKDKLPEGMKPLQKQLIAAVEGDLKTALTTPSTSQAGSIRPAVGEWSEFVGEMSSGLALSARSLGEIGKFPKTLMAPLRNKVLESFNGSNFGSTFETAQTLLNLMWFFELEVQDPVLQKVPVIAIDGKPFAPAKDQIQTLVGGFQVKVPIQALKVGGHQLKVDSSATSRLVLKKSIPLDQVQAKDEVAQIRKEYFKVNEKSGALTPAKDLKFQVGDLVYVKIGLSKGSTARGYWQSQYFAMKEFVPAGMSIVDQDANYAAAPFNLRLRDKDGSRRVIRTDGLQWYFQFNRGWNDTGDEVGYLMRANFSGVFAGGVTQFEDFYEEGMDSHSPGARFTIERR